MNKGMLKLQEALKIFKENRTDNKNGGFQM